MCIGLLHVIVSFFACISFFVFLSVHLCTLLPYLVNKDVYKTIKINIICGKLRLVDRGVTTTVLLG